MFAWMPNFLVIPVGLVIGVLIAAPVGPVNILCIQRSIERGMFAGAVAGAGAVLADGLIALSAAMGVGVISGLVSDYRVPIQTLGALALMAFGVQLLLAAPNVAIGAIALGDRAAIRDVVSDLKWDMPKAFVLTITNPAAVLGLFAIFGGISSFVSVRGPVDALIMVASIMIGSLAWRIGLSFAIGLVRERIDLGWLKRINQGAGLLLIAFAIVVGGELLIEPLMRG